MANKGKMGEGNYEAAEEYNEAQHKFVNSGKVQQAQKKPPASEDEHELLRAEVKGRARAKGEDPALRSKQPVKKKP